MALITTLNTQPDFTGEFPEKYAKSGLWRFNESTVDDNDSVSDSSGCGRSLRFINWSGTTANLTGSQKGNCARINISSPTTEKSYLYVENDGSIFENIGERIIVGGWINPTIYSVSNTYCPIFNTRNGPGQPILYLSLYSGRPRLMLYDSSGSLILDETLSSSYQLNSDVWYFIAAVIEPSNRQAWYVIGNKDAGTVQISDVMTFTGTLSPSCTADLVWGNARRHLLLCRLL